MASRAVLFDLDGTLVNTLPDICGNLNLVRAAHGLEPLPVSEIRPWIGKGGDYLIENTFKKSTPLSSAQISEIYEQYRESNAANPHLGGALYPGVLETLTKLRERGMKLAIATNKSTKASLRTLEHYLPDVVFDFIGGPEKVSERKPSPKHLLEVLERIGVTPENAHFVGDDPVDLKAATAAKVPFFAATWGFGGVRTGDARDLKEFPELLKKVP